jgi:DNA-binding NarL/FixJ family response regulator
MAPAADQVIRVLVVDDHPMVREGLRSMLAGDGVDVVAEADSGAEALRLAAEQRPDVVLLDLELPDMDGLTVLRRMRETDPTLPVLVVTMHEDAGLMRRAVQAGAAGYVLKGIGRRELRASLGAVCQGESVLDPALLRAALDADVEGHGAKGQEAPPALSRVERDLLQLIAAGLTNRQIAADLRWSQATVKKYVQRILEKLAVSDRTQAAVQAVRRGLLD